MANELVFGIDVETGDVEAGFDRVDAGFERVAESGEESAKQVEEAWDQAGSSLGAAASGSLQDVAKQSTMASSAATEAAASAEGLGRSAEAASDSLAGQSMAAAESKRSTLDMLVTWAKVATVAVGLSRVILFLRDAFSKQLKSQRDARKEARLAGDQSVRTGGKLDKMFGVVERGSGIVESLAPVLLLGAVALGGLAVVAGTVGAAFKAATKLIGVFTAGVGQAARTVGRATKVVASWTAGLFAAGGAISAVLAGLSFKAALDAASETEQSVRRLRTALQSVGVTSQKAVDQFGAFAETLSLTTKFTKEQTLDSMALAIQMGLNANKAGEFAVAAQDMASALGIDVDQATRQLAKTLGGMKGELVEIIPEIRNLTKAQLQAGAAVDVLAKKFAGSAEKELKTYKGALLGLDGQLKITANLLIDAVGGTEAFSDIINMVSEKVREFTPQMAAFVAGTRQFGITLWRFFKNVILPIGEQAIEVLLNAAEAALVVAAVTSKIATFGQIDPFGPMLGTLREMRERGFGTVLTELADNSAFFSDSMDAARKAFEETKKALEEPIKGPLLEGDEATRAAQAALDRARRLSEGDQDKPSKAGKTDAEKLAETLEGIAKNSKAFAGLRKTISDSNIPLKAQLALLGKLKGTAESDLGTLNDLFLEEKITFEELEAAAGPLRDRIESLNEQLKLMAQETGPGWAEALAAVQQAGAPLEEQLRVLTEGIAEQQTELEDLTESYLENKIGLEEYQGTLADLVESLDEAKMAQKGLNEAIAAEEDAGERDSKLEHLREMVEARGEVTRALQEYNDELERAGLAQLKLTAAEEMDLITLQKQAVATSTMTKLKGIFGNALKQLAADFVAMAISGDINIKKLLSTTLNAIAQEAGVQALFELGKGFAALFLNPPEAAAHFQAAAIFGSVALAAGVAGAAIGGSASGGASGGESSTAAASTSAAATREEEDEQEGDVVPTNTFFLTGNIIGGGTIEGMTRGLLDTSQEADRQSGLRESTNRHGGP